MNELEMICMQMIACCGEAKSHYMQAVEEARSGRFENARTCMQTGDAQMREGQRPHLQLLQQEGLKGQIPFSLLLMHAEDQMLSAEQFKEMARQLIDVYLRLDENK